MSQSPARILVGRFGAPHGVRGEVRLKSFTAEPLDIADYKSLADVTGARVFRREAARFVKDDMLIVRVAEVRDRDAAAALTNLDLYVDRTDLPEPEEDEFYHSDLIGLRAERRDGSLFGTVLRVLNFGAGDILEIAPAAGDTMLLPFTKAAVPVVDVPGGRVVVEPPEEIDAKEMGES